MNIIEIRNIDGGFICSDKCKDNTVIKTLNRAVHEDTNLYRTFLPFNDLTGGKLLNGWLPNSNLRSCVLKNANLAGTNLANSDLSYSDLTGANLKNANLTKTDLTGAILKGADLRGARLVGAKYNKRQIATAITDETTIFVE